MTRPVTMDGASVAPNFGLFTVPAVDNDSTSKSQTDHSNLFSSTYPTYKTRIFDTSLHAPEFPGDSNILLDGFSPGADDDDFGNLPALPMPSSLFRHESPTFSAEIRVPKKKRPRAPKVNEALIIEGSRPRTRSRRALGE
ncbi:hypothetical protein B0H14DRAFT_2644412 [Mycena olivaceomarginata]|nr:hypothetical protein B0H14DRAFT_2644412 [Mycena olivaceomarginata]